MPPSHSQLRDAATEPPAIRPQSHHAHAYSSRPRLRFDTDPIKKFEKQLRSECRSAGCCLEQVRHLLHRQMQPPCFCHLQIISSRTLTLPHSQFWVEMQLQMVMPITLSARASLIAGLAKPESTAAATVTSLLSDVPFNKFHRFFFFFTSDSREHLQSSSSHGGFAAGSSVHCPLATA